MDFVGVVIAILSLLVTLLIGWNIYTLVDVRAIEENLDNSMKRFSEELEKKDSNNIITAIDLLMETSMLSTQYDKLLSSHLAFYYVAKGNGSNAVKIALCRLISNEILLVINMGEEESNSVVEKLSRETSDRYVRTYMNDIEGHDDVRTWLNRLSDRINKRI